ncbi:hypothetical protein EBX31_00980, partial [bacterium]|nr:hypothetical protein [bacterium]
AWPSRAAEHFPAISPFLQAFYHYYVRLLSLDPFGATPSHTSPNPILIHDVPGNDSGTFTSVL